MLNRFGNRWASTAVAVLFLLFSLVGLPTRPLAYAELLFVVGWVFNILTVRLTWTWIG
jgi:hypothetical protein